MKNERTEFDGVEVFNPMLVVKLGLVYDSYKLGRLWKLWEEAEKKALEQMPTFKATDFFHQEDVQKDGEALWQSYRWYTPKSNIK